MLNKGRRMEPTSRCEPHEEAEKITGVASTEDTGCKFNSWGKHDKAKSNFEIIIFFCKTKVKNQ